MSTQSTRQNTWFGIMAVVGRFLLGAIFLFAGIMSATKIMLDFNGAVAELTAKGLPFPHLMAVGAVVFLLGGSLSVILGFRARLGAVLLLVFLVLTQLYFHNFWAIEAPEARGNEITHFLKNLSLIGAS